MAKLKGPCGRKNIDEMTNEEVYEELVYWSIGLLVMLIVINFLYITYVIEPILAEELPSRLDVALDFKKSYAIRQQMRREGKTKAWDEMDHHKIAFELLTKQNVDVGQKGKIKKVSESTIKEQKLKNSRAKKRNFPNTIEQKKVYSVKILKPDCNHHPCYSNHTLFRFQVGGLKKKQKSTRKLIVDGKAYNLGTSIAAQSGKRYNTSINLDGLKKGNKHKCIIEIEIEENAGKYKSTKIRDSVEFFYDNPPVELKKDTKITHSNRKDSEPGDQYAFFVDSYKIGEIFDEKDPEKLRARLGTLLTMQAKAKQNTAEAETTWIDDEIDMIKFALDDLNDNVVSEAGG